MSGMTILCVEDQFACMATLTCMLEGIGYDVMPARSEQQAIDLLANQKIDGVLVEYNLPGATGTELRAQLKAMRPDIPVLLFEGVGSQTPVMLRFFDAYLRNVELEREESADLDL
jgi:CheY-like chemotaxis protein